MRDEDSDGDASIRFLLAGGKLSGADHDRIIERLRRGDIPARRPRWAPWLGLGAALSGAAAALVMGFGLRHPPDGGGFTAKGPVGPSAELSARCLGRERGGCRIGDKLLFEVDGETKGGLLAAYVERPDGERVWYFPTKEGHMATVPAGTGRAVIGEAARIGEELGPGHHTLHLFIVDHQLDREALIAGAQRPRVAAAVPLEVAP